MSELYPDLPLTAYPNTLDQFLTYLSISSSDGPIIQQYMDAMDAGNQTLANQILATLPSASQKIITATDYNKFAQCIQAIERFYTTDIKPYIEQQQESWLNVIQQFSYEGTWSTGTSYQANNIVSYTVSGLTLLFIATSTPPAGTPPTNSNYWRTLTIQGVQGESGVGLAYRQEWSASETYQPNDCVSLDGVLWMALQTNSNVQPGTNDQYWQRAISLEAATYPIQAAQPVAQDVGGIWFNTSDNPTNYYYLETLDNPATAQEIWSGYQAYDAEGRTITGELLTYTKDEILTDSTKALYSLGNDAVPDDVFQALASAASGGAKIQTGSYVGTGTYGSSNPCSLTFDFEPKLFLMVASDNGTIISNRLDNTAPAAIFDALTTNYKKNYGLTQDFPSSTGSGYYGRKSTDGKTLQWYNTVNAAYQFNTDGDIYYYLIVG